MSNDIKIEIINGNDIEQCRELCEELMKFQKEQAMLHSECFDGMTFDTRMKRSFDGARDKQVVVVKDGEIPIGYVFSTIDMVTEEGKNSRPDWAPEGGIGFYPDWLEMPQKTGCLSNLYFKEEYRGLKLGSKLFKIAMEWLESFSDVNVIFVYISNGNDAALDFYLKNGFIYSHDVFGGFIKTAYKKLK